MAVLGTHNTGLDKRMTENNNNIGQMGSNPIRRIIMKKILPLVDSCFVYIMTFSVVVFCTYITMQEVLIGDKRPRRHPPIKPEQLNVYNR